MWIFIGRKVMQIPKSVKIQLVCHRNKSYLIFTLHLKTIILKLKIKLILHWSTSLFVLRRNAIPVLAIRIVNIILGRPVVVTRCSPFKRIHCFKHLRVLPILRVLLMDLMYCKIAFFSIFPSNSFPLNHTLLLPIRQIIRRVHTSDQSALEVHLKSSRLEVCFGKTRQ